MTRQPQGKKGKQITIISGLAVWQTSIDDTLNKLNNPSVLEADKNKLKVRLKEIVTEAITILQDAILTGKSVLQVDPIGFTKGKTAWGKPSALEANPYCYLVDQYCQEVLDAQKQDALDNEALVGKQELVDAVSDANDDEKNKISLKSADGKSEMEIDKETGDTTFYEPQADGSKKQIGFFKRWWKNVKDFAVSIFSWVKDKLGKAWNWFVALFKSPEDRDVIQANAS